MIRHTAMLIGCLLAATGAQATVDDARAKGLAWLVGAQRGDGSFAATKGLEVQATAAAVEAMLHGGMTRSPQYARALSWLDNAQACSIDALAWQATALALAGRDATRAGTIMRNARNTRTAQSGSLQNDFVTWGAYPGHGASILDTALGYGGLRSAGVTFSNDTTDLTRTVLCVILPAQLTSSPWSGAWPLALPQSAQPAGLSPGSLPATAMMLYELKKQRQAGRFLSGSACNKSSPAAIDTAMTSAKNWLIAQANGDGGLAERNPQTGALGASHPLATALAIRTLAVFAAEGDAAAQTAVNNARIWLAGRQDAKGSWGADAFVTARVLAALPAAAGAQAADSDGDGLPDVVEAALGTQATVADAQSRINDTANAIPGLTATSFSASGTVGQAFSYSLSFVAGAGGTHTFVLVNGVLPPGITLASDGTLSGIPTAAGSYAFDYEARNATGETLIIGRIDIAAAMDQGGDDGDVPLPGWALVLLGGGLLAAMRRRSVQSANR